MNKQQLEAELGKLYFQKEQVEKKISAIKTLLNLSNKDITLDMTEGEREAKAILQKPRIEKTKPGNAKSAEVSTHTPKKRPEQSSVAVDSKSIILEILTSSGEPMKSKELFAAYQAAGGDKPLLTFNTYMSRYAKDKNTPIVKAGRGLYSAE